MSKLESNVMLSSFDDIFKTEEITENSCEKIVKIPISELFPFKDHPFKVKDDETMNDTKESIEKYGVLVPGIVRPRIDGGYEIIAGHRRKRGCELAGIEKMPVIVRELDDDEAIIIMVDSNLQRENRLFSERAFAYKMKVDAVKRKTGRPLKNGSQLGNHFGKKVYELVGEQSGESKNMVYRLIRLTELVGEILDMVDEKRIAFSPAVELSYLTKPEQEILLDVMEKEEATPSLSQAIRLKKFSQDGKLTQEATDAIMSEEKKETLKITFTGERLKKYFPSSYTPQQIEETIVSLLENWTKHELQK